MTTTMAELRRMRAPGTATTTEEATIVRSINSGVKKSEGKCCCGGSLPVPSKGIRIWFTKEDESQGLVQLPVEPYDDASIEELVAASTTVPVVGVDGLVHELIPSSFATNFDLGQFFILDEIHKLLAPGAILRAQLQKLSILECGGSIKSQQAEKPSGNGKEAEFGSLVIALPFSYTGGDIVVSRGGSRSHSFSWGGEALDCMHWAAFVSGCEHEITEVTSGYQLTLRYNLYTLPENNKRKRVLGVSDTVIDPHSLPMYELLCEARKCSKFYAEGATLGFACQHLYAVNGSEGQTYKEMSKDEKTWLLKGADAMLFAAAKAAGLKVELRPIYRNGSDENPALLYVGKIVGEKPPGFLGQFNKEFDGLDSDTLGIEDLPTVRDGVTTDVAISWCLKNFAWVTGRESGHYKNEEVDVSWYYTTALLVTIPPWSERQEQLLLNPNSDSPASKKTKIYEDAITLWFKKAEERANREIDYDYKLEEDNEEEDEDEDDDDDEDDDEDDEEEEEEEDSEDQSSDEDEDGVKEAKEEANGDEKDVEAAGEEQQQQGEEDDTKKIRG